MRVIRLAGLAIIAVLAVSLAVASTGSAASYLFRASNVGNTFTGLSLAGTLKAADNTIACTDDVNTGTIANVHLLGPFNIKFVGCQSSGSGGSGCSVKSVGASAENEILTRTVHALLGTVLPIVGLGEGGLLVLPVSGKVFVQLQSNNCTPETLVTGTVAGLLEASQLGKLVLEALVLFTNSIKEIDTLAGLTEPKLSAFSEEGTLVTVEHLTFNKDTEVEVP
jgi:hypothetical protein